MQTFSVCGCPAKMRLLGLLLVITVVRGQFEEENYPHFYNLPKSFGKIATRLASLQDARNEIRDINASPFVNQYKELFNDGSVDRILKQVLDNNNSSRCIQDLEYLFQNIRSEDMWGLKMLDAFGKPESGFLEGNLKWMGNYHECTNIYVPPNSTAGGFHGQYCTLGLQMELFQKALPLTLGICIPESCNSFTQESLQDVFPQMSSYVNITQKTCQPVSKKLTNSAISMIVLLSFFAAIALIGSSITIFEYFSKGHSEGSSRYANIQSSHGGDMENQNFDSSSTALLQDENENNTLHHVKEFFKCFCVFSNGEKLLNTDSSEGQLLCLHGIRFLSMTWVILGHTYLMTLTSVGNMLQAMEQVNTWLFQVILNGFYSVDSFFLLSGFLVSYLYFQQASKTNGKIPWLYFYVHRYIRLTPVCMVVIGFQTALSYYMGSGPFWTLQEVDPVCKDNWWYNLLYINNFVPQAKECASWTWYLANDMQFFIVSPLILIALWRWPPVGYSILGILMSATIAANFGITYRDELLAGYGTFTATSTNIEELTARQVVFFENIYIKPYTRMSPYLVGIFLAHYIFKRKQSNQGKLHWINLCTGWVVASGISLYYVFCLYHKTLTLVESGFYNALSHAGFTAGLGWVIFMCLNGQAGPIDAILSFKLFIPLSRLTYCAYLIHPIILSAYFGSLETPFQFTHRTMVTLYLGLLVITYSLSFLVSVLFESPIIRLDKLIRTKLMSKPKT